MITTEEQIVYQILNTVRNAELNNDEVASERLVRSYIQKHRASILYKSYYYGMTIPDEIFQKITLNSFENLNANELKHALPPFISFEENFGLKLEKYGEYIPVINTEEYKTSIKTNYGKSQVKGTVENRNLILYKGMLSCCIDSNSMNANIIKHFQGAKPFADLQIVLSNPSDDPNYNWTTTPFPFPFELTGQLVQTILALEFNIILNTEPDKTGNANAENIKK